MTMQIREVLRPVDDAVMPSAKRVGHLDNLKDP
jgi:hypothetical protein